MQTPWCPRCAEVKLEGFDDPFGVRVWFCARCRGTLCRGPDVTLWLGGELGSPLERMLPNPFSVKPESAALLCPSGDGAELAPSRTTGLTAGVHNCAHCGALFIDTGVLPKLRAAIVRVRSLSLSPSVRPPREQAAPTPPVPSMMASLTSAGESLAAAARTASALTESEAPLASERLGFGNPWVSLLALPLALLLVWLMTLDGFGRLLLYPVQIQFHEVGHAIPAWLSGRAALPLPFGFTFWNEQRSTFVMLCVAFLLGMLVYRGLIERRRFAVLVGSALLLSQAVLSLWVSTETSKMLILLGGIAGELLLSCFAMVAFYFRLPDRFRWDFFRFVVLVPAAGSWVAAVQLWVAIARGRQALPMGSLLGTPGDGSGDLERLVAGYGYTPASITDTYMALVWLTIVILSGVYMLFATPAVATLTGKSRR